MQLSGLFILFNKFFFFAGWLLLNILAEDTKTKYYLLDEPADVDEFKIADLDFFKLYGIIDYRETFKVWLRKFPRPTFIVAVEDKSITSFIYIEPWEEMPNIVNVLRAQETFKEKRGKKIGYKLFLLGLYATPEYIITKPLTDASKKFYMNLGFINIKSMSMFKRYHSIIGYLVLPLNKRYEHLKNIGNYFIIMHI